jgi:hypothetical protein
MKGGDISQVYRLGDVFNGYVWRHSKNASNTVCASFPSSIACQYLRKSSRSNNWDLLMKIIKEQPSSIPENKTLVVHLRLGDVLDWPHYRNGRGCRSPAGCYYVRPLRYFEHIACKTVNKVVIVANPEYRENLYGHFHSMRYRDLVRDIFSKHNFSVIYRTSTPDKDLYYMCNAKYFLPSYGGFSNIARECVRRNNGIIVSDDRNFSCLGK